MVSPRPWWQKVSTFAKQSATDRTTPCRYHPAGKRDADLTSQPAPLPFKADRLQLRDMAFDRPISEWKLSAQRVNGGVVPWSPEAGKVLGTKAQIQLGARIAFAQ